MKKTRFLSSLLICMLTIQPLVLASTNQKLEKTKEVIDETLFENQVAVGSRRYNPVKSKSSDNIFWMEVDERAVDPGVGAVDITDYLSSESGKQEELSKSFSNFNTFKSAAIKIISWIPGIGQYIEKGSEIWSNLEDVLDDLRYAVPSTSKSADVETDYTYRYFTHIIDIYDTNQTWTEVGESISKYFYKMTTVTYYDSNKGEYDIASYHFSHSRNCNPVEIAEAPNYMNYSNLATLSYNAWKANRVFYEDYTY